MSADNYILIRKEEVFGRGSSTLTGGIRIEYVGYDESASASEPSYKRPIFNVFTLEDAILHAQQSEAEYGYRFEDIDDDVT